MVIFSIALFQLRDYKLGGNVHYWTVVVTGLGIIVGLLTIGGVFWRAARTINQTLEEIKDNTADIAVLKNSVDQVKDRLIAESKTQADAMRKSWRKNFPHD